jgi:hypothetical protein
MSCARQYFRHWIPLALLLLQSLPSVAQRGARVVPRSLDQMVQQAETIVHGSVISARVEPHPELKNLSTVVVSMSVQSILKGKAQKTMQFRQFIWEMPGKVNSAEYQKGQELVLLLGPVSKYGLTSPVGLDQGKFRVTHDSSGQAFASNGRGNLGLFQGTEQRAQAAKVTLSARTASMVRQSEPGPVPLADLKEAIQSFSGVK